MRGLVAVALCAGCATFEDPTIVLDLRVLGIETTPPEQILDIDPMDPPTFDEVLAQLQPIRVRALVAEPNIERALQWSMSACILDRGGRCDPAYLTFEFDAGAILDPETNLEGEPCAAGFSEAAGVMCAELMPDNRLVQMLYAAFEDDPARGLGGIDLGIVLRVRGTIGPDDAEAYAAKRVLVAPRLPAERRANNNPHIDQLQLGIGGIGLAVQKSHCADPGPVDVVAPGDKVTLFPVAREGDREEFVLPTLDGEAEHLTEYLEYQWIATAGKFTDEITGGPPDPFGNVKLDGTEWTAPDFRGGITLWVIQRDGRYGVRWREACIKVE